MGSGSESGSRLAHEVHLVRERAGVVDVARIGDVVVVQADDAELGRRAQAFGLGGLLQDGPWESAELSPSA